jgi:dipeptidyl aminopeptidase/acylaminoacyl peptidase
MSRIFLSHSSANNAAALALASWLESQGWSDYFLDISESRGLAPGERWMAALAAAVDRCEAVIFLVSPAWRDSKYCFAEFYQAKNLGKRIFGVIVEPIALSQLPEQMTAEWQVCDLTHSGEPVQFTVERRPIVRRTEVSFPGFALDALASGLRKAGLDPSTFTWPPPSDPGRSPYPGLRALDEPDAAVFFGRDAQVVRAMDQMRLVRERGIERLFVILGASGAGKSSFLRAGLLPRLRRDAEHFIVLPPIRPEGAAISGSQGLLASLRTALADAGRALSLAQVRNELADGGLAGVLRLIDASPQPDDADQRGAGRTVLIPIDQAEELLGSDGVDESRQFLSYVDGLREQLVNSELRPGDARSRVLLVITVRSDSLPRLQAQEALQRLSPVLFSLPPMPLSEFKSVIEGPARRHTESVAPTRIDSELTEKLMDDAQGADALPLLALALEWLYRELHTSRGTYLSLNAYRRLGGVRGVINKAVERAFSRPASEPSIPEQRADQERLLERVFPYIATVDPDTGEWKRRLALRGTLRDAASQADALVSRLIEQRLLLTDSRRVAHADDTTAPVEVVEVAHEALLRQWDMLERWLRTFAADLAATESIRRCANDWQRSQGDEVMLVHTAHRLQAALGLLADERLKGRFEPVDVDYLQACRERDHRRLVERENQLKQVAEQQAKLAGQQAARATLQRRVTWGLSATVVVVLGLLIWILMQTRNVSLQTSLVLASAAEAATDQGRYDQGVRLAVLATHESWLRPAHATARPALARAADGNAMRLLLAGHVAGIHSASFSPNSKRIVTASADNTARVWEADSGKPVGEPMKHGGEVFSASFSPDGTRVVTASGDNTARMWNADSGKPIGEPMQHGKEVFSASFSPDGKRVVTASGDTTARVWDTDSGKPIGEPMQHGEEVFSASFSGDGTRVVTASGDHTARVWDAHSGKPVSEPMKHGKEVRSASFSPDGKRVVTASWDKTARIWDAESGKPLSEPMTHDGEVPAASFSRDGRRVVTASWDYTARIWNADSGKPVGEPMKHDGQIYSASFSPDGKRVVTASVDQTARIWDADTCKPVDEPMKHGEMVYSASFSPDGKRVVTASWDRTARVWRAQWSAFDDAETLTAAACSRMNSAARRITDDDRRLAPVVPYSSRDEDVCADGATASTR